MNDTPGSWLDVPPPGVMLVAELRRLGITQNELAQRMGRSNSIVSRIVNGRAPITAEVALQIEAAIGVPAERWVTLEAEYRLRLARQRLRALKNGAER